MPRKKISKAEHIRRALAEMGDDARPRHIVAALAKKNVKVSTATVSTVKARLKSKGTTKGRGRSNDKIALGDLLAAKKLADAIGIDKAKAALSALTKLQ